MSVPQDDGTPTEPSETAAASPAFASDNTAGASPEVIEAVSSANAGWTLPYGADDLTAELGEWARTEFGDRAEIHPVFNGTGANVVALQALLPRWGAVICADSAHIHTDEGGAPERAGALKLLPRSAPEGRLTAADIAAEARALGFVHAAQPLAVSLTQSTELGTLYTAEQIGDVAAQAHRHGMGVHVDGARLANAAAALDVSLGEITAGAGVDVVSLGGTKNGAMSADAVVIVDPQRVHGLELIRKYSMQLASKQRFLSAQLLALFGDQMWRRNAGHANSQARRLGRLLEEIDGVRLSRPSEVNAVFVEMPQHLAAAVQRRFVAHTWDTASSGSPVLRLMCSWQTSDDDVEALVQTARRAARLPRDAGMPL